MLLGQACGCSGRENLEPGAIAGFLQSRCGQSTSSLHAVLLILVRSPVSLGIGFMNMQNQRTMWDPLCCAGCANKHLHHCLATYLRESVHVLNGRVTYRYRYVLPRALTPFNSCPLIPPPARTVHIPHQTGMDSAKSLNTSSSAEFEWC